MEANDALAAATMAGGATTVAEEEGYNYTMGDGYDYGVFEEGSAIADAFATAAAGEYGVDTTTGGVTDLTNGEYTSPEVIPEEYYLYEEPELFGFSPEDVLIWDISTPEDDVMHCVETEEEGYNLHCLFEIEGEQMTVTGYTSEYADGYYFYKYLKAEECFNYE